MNGIIEPSWKKALQDQFEMNYFKEIFNKLETLKKSWESVYPPEWLIFNAFDTTPIDTIKVIVLGQDPYHWSWQAHWLSFSVPEWVTLPPSLKNIFKEIIDDYGWTMKNSWDLTYLAQQWVFLLNSILTVSNNQPWSHKDIWRQQFTDYIIQYISATKDWLVFLLRWNYAKSKKQYIDSNKHLILESKHPSPFSAYSWFFWCKHFSKTNEYLKLNGKRPIIWL